MLSSIELKHKSRRLFIKEGMLAKIKTSLGFYYLSPFAIAINISSPLVAFLSSISGLLGPISQIFGSKMMEKNSRKKIASRGALLESLAWLPIILVGILYMNNLFTGLLPLIFLLVFSFYVLVGGLIHPAWYSWIGDLVDANYRGRWFSKRITLINVVGILFGIGSAFFLDYFKRNSNVILGFIVLFFLAFLARFYSVWIFKKSYEPKLKIKKKDEFTLWDFIKMSPKTNYGKLTLFRMTLGFATSITSSLFAIYILRDLGFNYFIYMLITFIPVVTSLFTLNLWGKICDKYGNYRVLWITSIFLPLIPISLTLSTSKIYLILVPSLLTALSWGGFELATSNFTYDNVSKQKVALANSHYNLLRGVGIFFGAGLGAILIKYLQVDFIKPILLIFIAGGILRAAVILFWVSKIKEIKRKKNQKISLRNFIIKEAKPTLMEEAHEIISIPNYLKEKE